MRSALQMPPRCLLSLRLAYSSQMFPRCLPVLSKCFPNVFQMPPRCFPDASHPKCLPSVSQMPPSFPDASRMLSRCFPDVSSMDFSSPMLIGRNGMPAWSMESGRPFTLLRPASSMPCAGTRRCSRRLCGTRGRVRRHSPANTSKFDLPPRGGRKLVAPETKHFWK